MIICGSLAECADTPIFLNSFFVGKYPNIKTSKYIEPPMNKIPLTKEDFNKSPTIWIRNVKYKDNDFLVTVITPDAVYVTSLSSHYPYFTYRDLEREWEYSFDRVIWSPCHKDAPPTDTEVLDWLEKNSTRHLSPLNIRKIVGYELSRENKL